MKEVREVFSSVACWDELESRAGGKSRMDTAGETTGADAGCRRNPPSQIRS